MYCPKCGAQNQDHLAYCRECGENLQVISQAMKKYSPVALVSKLDAVIEKKNERFRRDAILNALQGTVVIILTVFTPFIGSFFTPLNFLMFLVGIFMIFQSGWFFLAYRRSLELRKKLSIFVKKPLSIFGNDESLPPDISQIGTLPGDTGAATNKLVAVNDSQVASIYCPRCGVQNLENVVYCCACGTNLDFRVRPQGMERYLPAFLVSKLDAVITKNEKADYKSKHKSGWTLLIVAVVFLFNVIIQVWMGDWGFAAFYLVIGFVLVITSGWNLIAFRRSLEKENKSLDASSNSLTGKLPIHDTSHLGAFLYEMNNLPTTDEFSPQDTQDTLPLESLPPSITEATTKPLDPEVKQVEQDEILTARNFVKPRD